MSVCNTSLTSAEIQSDMYNQHTVTEENLLVYWKADAGDGALLYDHSGNANHATINGATWSTDTPILFEPETKEELQTAVDLWVSDNDAALTTYGDISIWNVSSISDMSNLFIYKNTFNDDITNWNVSNVTNMGQMFHVATSFNQDLSSWDVSNVLNFSSMFWEANSFNQNLSNWDVSSATSMDNMFGANETAMSDANKCLIHFSFSSNNNWSYEWDESCIQGCMDPIASNYNSDAEVNDGSCTGY